MTLSAILKPVWALLLRCFTGQSEVCFGYFSASGHQDGANPIPVRFVRPRSIEKPIRQVENHPCREETQEVLQDQLLADSVQLYNTADTEQSSAFAQIPYAGDTGVNGPSSATSFPTELVQYVIQILLVQ